MDFHAVPDWIMLVSYSLELLKLVKNLLGYTRNLILYNSIQNYGYVQTAGKCGPNPFLSCCSYVCQICFLS